jgi:hypothetical protein
MSNPTNPTYVYDIRPELAAALVAACSETRDVSPDAENPFHHSSYATLSAHIAATKAIFAKHGLAIIQFPIGSAESVGIRTCIVHKSGGQMGYTCELPVDKDKFKGQDAGSLFSYLRRYAIASVANLATADDDAEADRASKAPAPKYIPNPVAASAPKAVAKPQAVAKDPETVGDAMRTVLHFGKNKGKALFELPSNSLEWYIKEFQPKGYKDQPPSPQDIALRAALDAIQNAKGQASEPTSDDVPF